MSTATEAVTPTATDGALHRTVALALSAGFVLEVAIRGGPSNLAATAGVGIVVALLLSDGRIERCEARLFLAATLVPALFLSLRASPWLAAANVAAGAGLALAGVLYGRTGSIFDTSPGRALVRARAAVDSALAGFASLARFGPILRVNTSDRVLRVGRALLIAVPVVLVLVGLLASADAVFASFVTPNFHALPLVGHVALTLVVAAVVFGVRSATDTNVGDEASATRKFGVLEVVTMLALMSGLLALFVTSQLVVLTGAGRRLVESAGLTPAEYARSGFFQLCWATGILLAFLGVVRGIASRDASEHTAVRWLGAVVPALALGLVAVSLRRMALYDHAFGLTMLRLCVVGAAVWMGVVLVMTAARNAGFYAEREWLAAAVGVALLAIILVADVANPEAFVVRHNLRRAAAGAELDSAYLSQLSDDAAPTLAQQLPSALRCHSSLKGVAALNLAVVRADRTREKNCP